MNVRRGDVRKPEVALDHAAHEAEKAALRVKIMALEAALERKTEALERLLDVWNRLHDNGDNTA